MLQAIRRYADAHPGRAGAAAGWFQQACSGGAALLLVPFLVGHLGPTITGVWFAFQGFLAFAQLADFGFGFAISRQIAFTRHHSGAPMSDGFLLFPAGMQGIADIGSLSRRLYSWVVLIAVALSTILFELVLPLTAIGPEASDARSAWYLCAAAAVTGLAAGSPSSILIGLGLTHWVRLIAGCGFLLQAAAVAIAVSLGGELTAMAAASFGVALSQLAVTWGVRRLATRGCGSPSEDAKRQQFPLLRIAAPVGLVNASSFLVSSVQVPLVASLLGPDMVAPFYLAQRVGQFLNRAALQVFQPQLPFFTRAIAENDFAASRRLLVRNLWIAVVLLSAASLAFLGTEPVIRLATSDLVYPGIMVVALLAFDYFLLGVSTTAAQFVLASGRNPFVISTIINGVLNLAAIFIIVPRFGLIGLPLASIVSGLATNYWLAPKECRRLFRRISNQ